MVQSPTEDAIVIQDVVKSFRKKTIRGEYTTFKSELVRWLRGQRNAAAQGNRFIESLRGVNLRIPKGQTVAILGRNGSGKSTLLKLITGIYTPTSGSIQVNGRISALLDLGAGFHPDFSGRENILINGIILGMSRAEVRAKMDDIIAFSELGEFIDEPVRTYSSGMYMRLAFSVATHVDPDILIIDEILAVGDEHFSKKSLAKMTEFKRLGKTIVLVTHDMSTVERWCDQAAWLDGGRIRRVGTPSEIAAEYRQAVSLAEARSTVFTPPALTEGGGALPSLPEGPVVRDEPPASPPVAVSKVGLVGPRGEELGLLTSETQAEVCIDYVARESVEDVEFVLTLSTADGAVLYVTSTRSDRVPLPSPLPPQGRLRFLLPRVGLLGGSYVLSVELKTGNNANPEPGREARCTFSVSTEHDDRGVFRPEHTWVVEEAPAAPVQAVSVSKHAAAS
ncbi:ABC transporter ATP-binding protein [Corallococcus sp. AB049A]|uniref:ABC transporter ATP-binding protein n=1 Tax=Corallococcus sp. AB049A TaxID=2316721 RepID=UPI000EA308B1|nr:ABC transporter ATP-binding protein [Corallococcus sp. AB049A]RKH53425.1 ABC transporter ATP-binding protein [Corallococcus sp. AB050B]RKI67036.1 ABC transporter ATP-binding protein [Corallococcus sp. AB049A]